MPFGLPMGCEARAQVADLALRNFGRPVIVVPRFIGRLHYSAFKQNVDLVATRTVAHSEQLISASALQSLIGLSNRSFR